MYVRLFCFLVSVFFMHMDLAAATLWAIIKQECGRVTENNITLAH